MRGKLAKWSGLIERGDADDPPVLILNPDADRTGNYSKLEVRWKVRPDNLEKRAVEYHVAILTDMDEELGRRMFPTLRREKRSAASRMTIFRCSATTRC